jgi:hypothetical protein
MSLELIEQRVNEEVGRRTDEVLGLLFVKAKRAHIAVAHKESCKCNYCESLARYTRAKISLSKTKKHLDEDCFDIKEYEEKLQSALNHTKELRERKNKAKELYVIPIVS